MAEFIRQRRMQLKAAASEWANRRAIAPGLCEEAGGLAAGSSANTAVRLLNNGRCHPFPCQVKRSGTADDLDVQST